MVNLLLNSGASLLNGKPIIYLTQWKIVGNSEVHTLPYPDGVVLPTGYKRCKYLEFHGTEYFESGIASKEGIGITCRFKTTTAEKFLFGVRNGNNQDLTNYKSSFALYPKANSRALIGYGSTLQEVSNVNLIDGVEHTLQLNDTIAKVDNTDITFTRKTIVTPWNIPIGTARSGGVIDSRYYIGYLYSFILYDANGTLFNGIPCLDDNDVPCLYDTVSGTSFYNDGTGTFGYEIEPQPTEIWSCGEYNPIDGKYHILVLPLEGSITDIALTEPLRKVNNVADTIEFPAVLEAFTDADGNQIATILPDDTILHIQNLYDYTHITRTNVTANNISQRNAEIKVQTLASASYLGFGMPLQGGKYYSSCLFKNEDAKPNLIYSNSGSSPTVRSSDYQKTSLLKSGVTTFRYSALNNPTGVWKVNDVFFVKDINIFDIDAMFADCTNLKPASASDFEALFPNLGCIDRINTAIDVIVKDGKLYKYVETEGKALVTRNIASVWIKDISAITQMSTTVENAYRFKIITNANRTPGQDTIANILCNKYPTKTGNQVYNANTGIADYTSGNIYVYDADHNTTVEDFINANLDTEVIYELATPTTELVDAPQIAEADSYTCVISQGAKTVEWSSFDTD